MTSIVEVNGGRVTRGNTGRYLPSLKAHKGWTWANVDDLEDNLGECEACGQEIRYAHLLLHPEHPSIVVGETCARSLTEDYVNPERREKELRAKASRKKRELRKYPGYYGYGWVPLPPGLEGGCAEVDGGWLKVKKLVHKWAVDYYPRSGIAKSRFIFAKSLPDAANQAVVFAKEMVS